MPDIPSVRLIKKPTNHEENMFNQTGNIPYVVRAT